jgi:glycosyltransferase involved in cell wall biosynthesis
MDLLVLFEYPTLCGGEQSMLCLLPSIQRAGWRVRAVAPVTGRLAEALAAIGVEVLPHTFHDPAGVRRPLETCRAELAELFVRVRPDLLHANSLSMARLSGPVAAEHGLPSIGHLRDIVRLSRRAVGDVNRHMALLTVSRAARDFHVAQGIEPAQMSVLYNAVDLGVFRPRPPSGYLHRELRLPAEARLVASIGQIGPRKGWDQLLLAMRQIASDQADIHLLIVGERFSDKAESVHFERNLRNMAAVPPLIGRVHFLGWRTDVAELLPELALLAHAARQEPLGRVLLEAAACACPVVATDVGGTAEIFAAQDERQAILVPREDSQALASAIQTLLHRPLPKQRQGPPIEIADRFGIPAASKMLLEQYRRVVRPGG